MFIRLKFFCMQPGKHLTFNAHCVYIECMAKIKLSASDREFFGLVSRASFTNPFSDQRLEIDRAISGREPETTWSEVRPEAIGEIGKRIAELDGGKTLGIDDFQAGDRQLIEHLYLFDVYHQFNQHFDKLIEPPGDAMSDTWQLIEVARRMGHGDLFPWTEENHIEKIWEEYGRFHANPRHEQRLGIHARTFWRSKS